MVVVLKLTGETSKCVDYYANVGNEVSRSNDKMVYHTLTSLIVLEILQ